MGRCFIDSVTGEADGELIYVCHLHLHGHESAKNLWNIGPTYGISSHQFFRLTLKQTECCRVQIAAYSHYSGSEQTRKKMISFKVNHYLLVEVFIHVLIFHSNLYFTVSAVYFVVSLPLPRTTPFVFGRRFSGVYYVYFGNKNFCKWYFCVWKSTTFTISKVRDEYSSQNL